MVSFLHAPRDDVLDHLLTWKRSLGLVIQVGESGRLPDVVSALDPMEAPWTRELLFDCGQWTAYLNNGIFGGDPTASAPAIATAMKIRLAVAMHAPSYGPGHASTQLSFIGPDGVPPLMYERTLSAHAEDGRWKWDEGGQVQPFEDVTRYTAHRIRDRLDRALLIEYLAALGISADDPDFYGMGVPLRNVVDYKVRREPVSSLRQWFRAADMRE